MIYGLGMLESGITFDYGQLVLDCEFARMIKHTLEGISVNHETLAVDAVKETGPGGNFLMNPHTFKWMITQSRAEMIDRKMRNAWEEAGATTAYDRAMIKVKTILDKHQPTPLPDDIIATIRSIVIDTEKEIGI